MKRQIVCKQISISEHSFREPMNKLMTYTLKMSPVIFFLVICHFANAQSPKVIKVRAGNDPLPYFPKNERYLYKEFMDGYLFDQKGKPVPTPKMNFQMISGNLECIKESGDTVVIDNEENHYKNVMIHGDYFYFDRKDGYFQMLTRDGSVRLLSKRRWLMVRRERAVNDGPGGSALISSHHTSTRRDPKTGQMIRTEDFVYAKVLTFYLMDAENEIDYATKSTFINLFPDYKKQIREFTEKNNIEFEKEEDVKKLLKYCNALK